MTKQGCLLELFYIPARFVISQNRQISFSPLGINQTGRRLLYSRNELFCSDFILPGFIGYCDDKGAEAHQAQWSTCLYAELSVISPCGLPRWEAINLPVHTPYNKKKKTQHNKTNISLYSHYFPVLQQLIPCFRRVEQSHPGLLILGDSAKML